MIAFLKWLFKNNRNTYCFLTEMIALPPIFGIVSATDLKEHLVHMH